MIEESLDIINRINASSWRVNCYLKFAQKKELDYFEKEFIKSKIKEWIK